jgi:hypothetical protein
MKLQFTNGYRPRFDQISRILQYLLTQNHQKRIPRQDIVSALGIPNKQVENLTSMMTGFGLVYPRATTLTPLGNAIIQSDPYFEKVHTLWMIHYVVSSNNEWVVWYRVVNTVIPTHDHISVEYVSNNYFSDLASQYSEKTIKEKLPKEVGAALASYTRSELSRLKILEETDKVGNFIKGNPVDIPDQAFLFCLLNYRDRFSPGSSAINVEELSTAEYSPGRVLSLPEYQVKHLLEDLHDRGLIRLEQFANLDQVRFSKIHTQESALAMVFGEPNGT